MNMRIQRCLNLDRQCYSVKKVSVPVIARQHQTNNNKIMNLYILNAYIRVKQLRSMPWLSTAIYGKAPCVYQSVARLFCFIFFFFHLFLFLCFSVLSLGLAAPQTHVDRWLASSVYGRSFFRFFDNLNWFFYCAQQKYTHKLWISYKDCWRLLYTHQDRVNVYLRIRNCVGWLSLFLAFCSCIWRTFKKISLHATFSAVVQSILCGSTQQASNAIYSIEQHHAYESRNQSDLINATWQHINIEMAMPWRLALLCRNLIGRSGFSPFLLFLHIEMANICTPRIPNIYTNVCMYKWLLLLVCVGPTCIYAVVVLYCRYPSQLRRSVQNNNSIALYYCV